MRLNPQNVYVPQEDGSIRSMPKAGAICDFCSSKNPIAAFRSQKVVIKSPLQFDLGTDDAWAACEPCADLIRKDDRKGLANHVVERFAKRLPLLSRDEIAQGVAFAHDVFWSAYIPHPSKE